MTPTAETVPPITPDPGVISPSESISPLDNGDRLTRAEFERRYNAMPHVKKAELIEGVVYVPSPVSPSHGSPHFNLITWLGLYHASTPELLGCDNTSLRLDMDNEPQPDVFLLIQPAAGGQSRFDEDGYVAGAPELVAEVAVSSASYDLHDKLMAYRRNGVREYLVWRVRDQEFDWRILRDSSYELLPPGADGLYRSEVFPGLWLDPVALLNGDLARVIAVLQQGLSSPEHSAFAAGLRQRSQQ